MRHLVLALTFAIAFADSARSSIVVNSDNALAAFNPTSGAFLGNVGSGGEGGVVFGPDGRLYWINRNSGVLRVDTSLNGGVFVGPGNGPYFGLTQELLDLDFGPDGNLYVSKISVAPSPVSGILRYDGITGTFVDLFLAIGDATSWVRSFAFGPNNDLYVNLVTQFVGSEIRRFDSATGQLLDVLVPQNSSLGFAYELSFGPDANLYVSHRALDQSVGISRYDVDTGNYIDEFVADGDGGLSNLRGFGFDPSGSLFVVGNTDPSSGGNPNKILQFDGTTGDFIGDLTTPDSGFINGSFLAFAPLEFPNDVGAVPELSSAIIWMILVSVAVATRGKIRREAGAHSAYRSQS